MRRCFMRKLDRYPCRTLGWSQGAAFFFVPWQFSHLAHPFLQPSRNRCGIKSGHITNKQILEGECLQRESLWWGWLGKFIFHSYPLSSQGDIWQWLLVLSSVFDFWGEGGGRGSGVMEGGMSILDRCVKAAHSQRSHLILSCPQQCRLGTIILKYDVEEKTIHKVRYPKYCFPLSILLPCGLPW